VSCVLQRRSVYGDERPFPRAVDPIAGKWARVPGASSGLGVEFATLLAERLAKPIPTSRWLTTVPERLSISTRSWSASPRASTTSCGRRVAGPATARRLHPLHEVSTISTRRSFVRCRWPPKRLNDWPRPTPEPPRVPRGLEIWSARSAASKEASNSVSVIERVDKKYTPRRQRTTSSLIAGSPCRTPFHAEGGAGGSNKV